jgi:tRNA(His) guanylyltransferase
MKDNDSYTLGNRIKRYEKTSRFVGTPRTPMIIRVDGKAFHTFTRNCKKPFDIALIEAMRGAAREVGKEMQGFKAAYVQSDEATFLLTDYDQLKTQGWFGYVYAKMISISAASMSVNFNELYSEYSGGSSYALFDSRAFNVPVDDVANVFLWRAKDWERNSLQMYARSFFSHKELNKKNSIDIHEMLHGIGKNWTTDLSHTHKNGTFITKDGDYVCDIKPTYSEINEFISENL